MSIPTKHLLNLYSFWSFKVSKGHRLLDYVFERALALYYISFISIFNLKFIVFTSYNDYTIVSYSIFLVKSLISFKCFICDCMCLCVRHIFNKEYTTTILISGMSQ